MQNINVKCDKCGWNKEVSGDGFREWHNKVCPCCLDSVIIDDKDMAIFLMVKEIERMDKELGGDGEPQYHYRFDTAPMRDGKLPTITEDK